GFVGVHGEDEDIAQSAGFLQKGDVAGVQKIEASISEDDAFALRAELLAEGVEIGFVDELAAQPAGHERLTNIMGPDGGGAAATDGYAGSDIGEGGRLVPIQTAGDAKGKPADEGV